MEFVEQLKSAVDIVKVIGEYGVRLRKTGASRYSGLCPFHSEKTPSFSVHAGHQFYKCFGCGAGGDVLKFVMEIERLSFFEALKLLAERHGIPMPRRAEYSDPETRMRAAVFQMHEAAEKAFRDHLQGPAGAEARAYLERRGVSPETAAQFGLGYADRSGRFLLRLLEQQRFTPEQLEQSGLVGRRQDGSFYDRFRNRLMFPIHSESGKTIGFGGRALESGEEPKYLNSPETPIYKKSFVLYNLHRAKDAIHKNGRAVLVEGYMDVIGVSASGVGEVVATCGTALTGQQVQMMKRHAPRLVVNFDPDAPGTQAAERSINLLLSEGMQIRILELDGGLDPDEYCKERGAQAYAAMLEEARGYFYWLADRARQKFDMRTAEGRVAAFQFLLPSILRLNDKIERVAVANDVAGYLGVDSGLVLENFRKAASERREAAVAAAPEPPRAVERMLLNLLLASEEAQPEILPPLREMEAVDGFATRRIFKTIFALHDAGARIGFESVHARLEDSDKDMLLASVFAEDGDETMLSLEQGRACLRTLQSAGKKTPVTQLKARIRQAERAGDLAEALRLTAELNALERGAGRRSG